MSSWLLQFNTSTSGLSHSRTVAGAARSSPGYPTVAYRSLVVCCGDCPLPLTYPSPKPLIQVRITAIEPSTRWVTLAGASGQQVTLVAGPAVRLVLLKVGDTVVATY